MAGCGSFDVRSWRGVPGGGTVAIPALPSHEWARTHRIRQRVSAIHVLQGENCGPDPTEDSVRAATPQGWPLLGREAELRHLAEAIAGRRPGIVLAGAPGVGKTRLAREAIRQAEEAGSATTWVVATRSGASIPFGPFAHLLPETLPPTTSRLELLCWIAGRLSSRGGGRRVVVGIDDAHLLDDASAALAHQLASSAGFFVLTTLRVGEAAPDSVTALWKDALVERLEVHALPEDLIGQLASRALGGQVDGLTLARLWDASRGNVLFLRELLLAGQESRALRYTGGIWSWTGPMVVSSRLQEVLDARLGTLQADQVALTEVLAYAEPAPVSFLETLFPPSTLEASERQGMVVVEKDGRRLAVRLAHPLYGESVRARCPLLRARDIQRQLAAWLEATGARRRSDLLRMATARLGGGGSGPPQLLVAGARRALASFDPVLAERLAQAAVDAEGGIPARHVLALSLLVRGRDGREVLACIDQLDPDDQQRVITAELGALGLLWVGEGRPAEAEALLLAAERAIKDERLRDELRGVRANVLFSSGQPVKAIAMAFEILQRAGASERASAWAALVAIPCLAAAGHGDEAVAVAERWIEVAGRADDSLLSVPGWLLGWLLVAKCYALLQAGRLHEAEASATNLYRRNLFQHARYDTAMSALLLGRVALARGRVQTAGQSLREAAALFRATPHNPNHLPVCLAGVARVGASVGDLRAADAALVEAEEALTPSMAAFRFDLALSRAWVASARGEVSRARTIALAVADEAEGAGQYVTAVGALHDVARFGDAPAVAPRVRQLASVVEGPLAPACAAHAEALAAHDAPRLEAVASSFWRLGARLLAAEAAAEAAGVYRLQGRKASMLASSARARAYLEGCEGARTPALSALGPQPLTPREREVATLACTGLRSARIAQRLVLSTRTVETYLQRAYIKLGVTSRSELRSVLGSPTRDDEG
jgi:DNA-binding CsgD family transcriptional regulator